MEGRRPVLAAVFLFGGRSLDRQMWILGQTTREPERLDAGTKREMRDYPASPLRRKLIDSMADRDALTHPCRAASDF